MQKQRTDYGVQTKIYIAEAEAKKNIANKNIAVEKYDYGVQQALRAVKQGKKLFMLLTHCQIQSRKKSVAFSFNFKIKKINFFLEGTRIVWKEMHLASIRM